MIKWGVIWGAVLGYFAGYYSGVGIFFGAAAGCLAGFSLRWAVRQEMTENDQKTRSEMLEIVRQEGNKNTVTAVTAVTDISRGEQHLLHPEPQSARGDDGVSPASTEFAAPNTSSAISDAVAASELRRLHVTRVLQAAQESATATERHSLNSAAQGDAADVFLDASPPEKKCEPQTPDFATLAFIAIKNWFLGGNTIVRVGLVIMFLGLSFLARFAASNGWIPLELRLGVIGVAAMALLIVGFRKREAKPDFALLLQGGGVAVIYLTVFAAFRLYTVLPILLAFPLMIAVCILSCALALLQNSRALAMAAFAGGFAVPILLSTGSGSHIGLFSYYTVLNIAILFIAHKRSWRILNLLGFIATFGVAAAWGALKYLPEIYYSTQPFLICFVIIYFMVAILYAKNTPTKIGKSVDTVLIFGTPLIGFGLQVQLVEQFEFGSAFSDLGFSVFYLGAATVLAKRFSDNYRVLLESLIIIGIGFLTLAIPLALDARWTSAVWALEGAGAFWVGMRQARWMPRAFGLSMQILAGLMFARGAGANVSAWPLANPVFIGAMFISLPSFAIAWWLRKPLPHSQSSWAKGYAAIELQLEKPVFGFAFTFWCLAWIFETARHLPPVLDTMTTASVFTEGTAQLLRMLAWVGSAGLLLQLGRRTQWAVAILPSRLTTGVLVLTFLLQLASDNHVPEFPGWIVWPVALFAHYWMLRSNDMDGALRSESAALESRVSHVIGVWLATLLLADCLWFGISRADLWGTSWANVVLLVSAVVVLMVLTGWAGRANVQTDRTAFKWPLDRHAEGYYWAAALPLAGLVFAAALVVAVGSSGRTDPLPYIPLLNPVDLTVALALGALALWRRVVMTSRPAPLGSDQIGDHRALIALGALAFVAVNTVWLRTAHHYFEVSWQPEALFDSFVVQTGFAILWTLLALGFMVTAHRRLHRPLWFVGAGLLSLVVLKLLLIDLSNTGGAARIIAFIAVGGLMLVVGYFVPLPPKRESVSGSGSAPEPDSSPAASSPAELEDVKP